MMSSRRLLPTKNGSNSITTTQNCLQQHEQQQHMHMSSSRRAMPLSDAGLKKPGFREKVHVGAPA